jgi:hypoxanthine phosphoribosyltransferase
LQKQSTVKLLIGKQRIAAKIKVVAREIDREYTQKDLVILMVLKGAVCFAADLLRAIRVPCDIEAVQCASYGARGTLRGDLNIFGLERINLTGRDVLIVDDIFDSGHTLTSLIHAVQEQRPSSIKSLVLLYKKVTHVTLMRPDYVLFEIEDHFVVGYGLDYKERYRGLSGVYIYQGES